MSNTVLNVTNSTSADVEVYVTFAADNPANECCPTPATVGDFSFLTEVNSLRGKFTLGAGQSQAFDAEGKCFSGNIGFYIEPQCAVAGADFNHGKEGTSIAEFTFNPNEPCFEAFDISMVNGINCYMSMEVAEGSGWHFGPGNTPITRIYNKPLQQNAGNPGVFPVNCTDCIQLVGNPPCPDLPIGPAQTERICNIQRGGRGGTVQLTLEADAPA